MQDATASKYIPTIAATYGCKISQLYEYDTSVYGRYDANCASDTQRIPAHAAWKTFDYRAEEFLHDEW